ncbi:MAG: hypothetical protein ABIX28_20740 [Vicinamibacterales bacterium]
MSSQYLSAHTDLILNETQRSVLGLLGDAASGMRELLPLDSTMRALVSFPLAMSATAAVAGMQCPYDHPAEAIVGDFDAARNMYLHCLHGTKHCWTLTGTSIACP